MVTSLLSVFSCCFSIDAYWHFVRVVFLVEIGSDAAGHELMLG